VEEEKQDREAEEGRGGGGKEECGAHGSEV